MSVLKEMVFEFIFKILPSASMVQMGDQSERLSMSSLEIFGS
jgi:hypothetical protein